MVLWCLDFVCPWAGAPRLIDWLTYVRTLLQEFKGITKWILPSEEEAEEVGPIVEGIIRVKLGLDLEDDDDDDEDEEEEEEDDDDE